MIEYPLTLSLFQNMYFDFPQLSVMKAEGIKMFHNKSYKNKHAVVSSMWLHIQ